MTIKSRPVYGILSPQAGKSHLLIADAEGASAILDLAKKAPEDFFDNAEIMFVPGPTGAKYVDALKALVPGRMYEGPSVGAAMPRLHRILGDAHMGLRIYVAGTEGLIGQVVPSRPSIAAPGHGAFSVSTARASPRT
jgi:hypothetical protein